MISDIAIIETDYGIASNYGFVIEINRKLNAHPKLKQKILNHELRHTSGSYNKQDFMNDFQSKDSYFIDTLKFCLKNPEGFINFFPFMYSYYFKEWTFNSSSMIPLCIFGLIFISFFKFTLGLSLLWLFGGWIISCLIWNAIFLLITHTYVKTTEFTNESK